MASIRLNFPVLVKNIEVEGKPQYYLRPLFVVHPVATHRRYENVLHRFKKEVRDYFKGFELSRKTADELLWFNFNPELKHELIHLQFRLGNEYINEHFGVTHFTLKGLTFVCLPDFNNYIFIAEKKGKQKPNIALQVENVITSIFRQKKKNDGEIFPEHYAATKGEFVVEQSFYIQVEESKFWYERSSVDWFFASISGGDDDFVGQVEVEKVGYDLNDRYPAELKRAYFREDLVQRLYDIIYQKDNTPVVLLGEEGVGKHSILHETVVRYLEEYRRIDAMSRESVWYIDPTRVIAGMSIVGMWQKRFEAILSYVKDRRKKQGFRKGNTDKVLIDNVVAMLRIGKSAQNDMTLSDVLKPYLEQRLIQMIIIATPEEWKIVQERDRRFSDLFQVLRVKPPSMDTAVKMVIKQRQSLELEHGGKISSLAIAQLFNIHRNYYRQKALPGSVMKLLRQLAVKYKFQYIDIGEVREEFEQLSGLNEEIFDSGYAFEENEVRDRIGQQLIGQETAVECLADVIHVIKAKLNNPQKPMGSFMFIGPTGVGKTQAAKVLCKYLLKSEDALMRFDMNEFIDETAIQRLIGDYYNPEGQLTGQVRYRPFGVVLFDEIEKAHPKVHDLLLQVLDDGRLTDSLGRTVDFTNTIIIMTSNVGAQEASTTLGFKATETDDSAIYQKALEKQFRPEFVNRIDRVVVFHPLKLEHIYRIARLQINELLSRDGFIRRTTILNISPDALQWVSKRGYNEKMGGRALKRQIEKDLTALSADQLIATPTDRPIIFEIELNNNKLEPKIIPLYFAEAYTENWLPEIPNEQHGGRFYNRLLKAIANIEDIIYDYQPEEGDDNSVFINTRNLDDSDSQYYQFKNRVADIKERLTNMLLGFRHKYFDSQLVIPFRMKQIRPLNRERDKPVILDVILQREAIEELSEYYQYSTSYFDKMNTQFMNDFLDIAILDLQSRSLSEKTQKVKISFVSCIANMGNTQIEFLEKRFKALLKGLDITAKINEKTHEIIAEGYGIYELLKGEAGLHLFYISHQTPLPIKVIIEMKAEKSESHEVIRVYHNLATLTDLRTGFSNDGNISAEEFKVFLYGGLPKGIRESLM